MKFPNSIRVFGNKDFRGICPSEAAEQITFFSIVRSVDDDSAIIATHIRNEGKRSHMEAARHRAEGMTKGASDIIIPGSPAFVCELKRRDHTKCTISEDQIKYLEAAQRMGAFACIALGHEAAIIAMEEWYKHYA